MSSTVPEDSPLISEKVWIIDFGSQYTQLIARRVRELGVYSEIRSPDVSLSDMNSMQPAALILSGGPSSVSEDTAPLPDNRIYSGSIPVLGICYGLQLITRHYGGDIHSSRKREYGKASIVVNQPSLLFKNIPEKSTVWMSHGDHVDAVPPGFEILAETTNNVTAAVGNSEIRTYGLQFHPEVVHTRHGTQILKNFLFDIAGCKGGWTAEQFIKSTTARIRKDVGNDRVLVALSGGVDSSVMAVLLHKAVGARSIPVFINNGLLRKDEEEQVIDYLKQDLNIPVKCHNYSQLFISRLKRIRDPERKRKIIGNTFIEVFEQIAHTYKGVKYLAQGTLYPDVIESRSVNGPSAVIKSHHNVGGLPEHLDFGLIEPLSNLFKDEVRNVGKSLNVPDSILSRHPFPGPGLGVRIIGAVNEERLAILREADHIFISRLKAWNLYNQVWQAFAVLLPVKAVGVMGDKRTYEFVCSLRAVTSMDGMTADWARLPEDFLSDVATQIVNRVQGINRVVYDITSKPPGTIEWE